MNSLKETSQANYKVLRVPTVTWHGRNWWQF